MFFKSKRSTNSEKADLLRSMQATTNEAGAAYEDTLNFLAKDLNHFRYASGTIDPNTAIQYLDYYADDDMIEDEVRVLEKMIRVMAKNVYVSVFLLSENMIRLEVRF